MTTNTESAFATIGRMYDEGKSLDAIVEAVGTDEASVRLIASRLGLSTRPGCKLDHAVRRIEARNPANVDRLALAAIRDTEIIASGGSHWKRVRRYAIACATTGTLKEYDYTPDAGKLADAVEARVAEFIDTAEGSVRGTEARYRYALRLALHAVDDPAER